MEDESKSIKTKDVHARYAKSKGRLKVTVVEIGDGRAKCGKGIGLTVQILKIYPEEEILHVLSLRIGTCKQNRDTFRYPMRKFI